MLVLRALGLGDLLTGVPALRALRRAYPSASITLAAPAWLSDVVARIDAVDRLEPTEGLVPIRWHGPAPDLAVNLHGSGPQSTDLLAHLEPSRLIAHREWVDDQHEMDRWCRLLTDHGIPADPWDFRLGDTRHGGPVVVHPGASHGCRRWPADRYAHIVRAVAGEVVVTGDASERELVEEVAGPAPTRIGGDMTGLLDLVANARLVICGDTGVAHVATAYGTPSVVLFGPVSPEHWGPKSGPHRALWHGRTGDTFADQPDPGLLTISVAEVLAAVADVTGGERWHRNASRSSARATSA
ncbi:hypothetical protein ALI144C_25040 [Actinosynnema sp. ALI-1.44]|nr:hypothetical protein ALI144C_25040 [Actinosynnema sp. ALI-1.44]